MRSLSVTGLIFRSSALPLLCLLFSVLPAAAITPAVLVHPDLSEEPIHIIGLGETGLVYFDAQRVQRTAPLAAFVQVRAIDGRAIRSDEQTQRVELIDGQALAGRWVGANADGSAMRWRHPDLGEVDLPLTSLSRVRLGSRPIPMPDAEVGDVVVLSNGDRMTGFVESVSDQAVSITLAGTDQAIELPIERLAGLSLANPPAPASPGRYLLLLEEGSRLATDELAWFDQELRLRPTIVADQPELLLPAERLVRIDAAGSGRVLRPLSSAAMRLTEGGQVFGVPFPPRADGETLTLHAPATVKLTLPAGARRLAATVSLDLPGALSEDRRAMADCRLIFRQDGAEPTVIALSAEQPEARINLPLLGGELELIAEEGAFGPILDRIALRDAVMLIETK